jgi:hypothetical protein
MSFSLHQAILPTYLQILGAVSGLVDKAEAHCAAAGQAPADLIQARLAEDMQPFSYQINAVAHHSMGAIDGVFNGVFSPPSAPLAEDFAGLRSRIGEAIAYVQGVDPAAVDAVLGQPMRFEMGKFRLDFTAENFLLSFSQPNFYFHATTAYDILRWQGLAVGKQDFLGHIRHLG